MPSSRNLGSQLCVRRRSETDAGAGQHDPRPVPSRQVGSTPTTADLTTQFDIEPRDLPPAPDVLSSGDITLRFVRVVPGDPTCGFVPFYHFRIVTRDGSDAGHINFRVGDSEHVRHAAGHVGFEVQELFRGHGYALEACRALAPFVGAVSGSVTLTCDPGNAPSRRTIERLGATFVDEVAVPPGDPHYARGSRTKLRYTWTFRVTAPARP